MNILVVDDDRDFAEGVADLLTIIGHQVTLAFDGETATEEFAMSAFDLCLMDLNLPGIDGIEATSVIRAARPGAKVLIMSAHATPWDVARALGDGALDVLSKPFEISELKHRLLRLEMRAVLLLVEDDVDFAAAISEHLRRVGFEVEHRPSVESALLWLDDNPPHLILLDLCLGDGRGLEVFRRVRSALPDLPIIVVSAFVDQESEDVRAMQASSLQGLMHKPLDPNRLVDRLDELLLPSQQ